MNADLLAVADLVHHTYDPLLGAPAVSARLDAVADRFDDATVRSFVPLMVRRFTEEELAVEAGASVAEVRKSAADAG